MRTVRRRASRPGENFWFCFWLLAFLVLIYFRVHHWLNREPSYEGKTLTVWLAEMHTNYSEGGAPRIKEEHAIRSMGDKCVPHLIKILKDSPRKQILDEAFRSAENDFRPLATFLGTQIHLPEEIDYSDEARRAFFILGRQAKSAIPYFDSIFEDTNNYSEGAQLLSLLGPVSIPTLTNIFKSKDQNAQWAALSALGQIGLPATNTFALVTNLLDSTNEYLSFRAIEVLGEMGDLALPLVPRFEQMLLDTNCCKAAAYSLARLKKLRLLAEALTNAQPFTQSAAFYGLVWFSQPRDTSDLKSFYHRSPRGANSFPDGVFRPYWSSIALLATNLNSPDPILRELVAGALGQYKASAWAAVPVLSNALSDEDPIVRLNAAESLKKIDVTFQEGGIVRGPRKEKKIALEFSGHSFAEAGETILNELDKHQAKASFFLTGDFVENPDFKKLFRRIVAKGHYVGSHSDKHLLYCPWKGPKTTLISSNDFREDLSTNNHKIDAASLYIYVETPNVPPTNSVIVTRPRAPASWSSGRYWLPSFEWYNQDIVNWSRAMGMALVNYTPGTRSNADYTQDTDTNFVSSQAIFDSIVKKEREDPDGLNGFLLLFHLGGGPGRTDKFSARFGELLDYLSARGYQFVRIDEMMEGK